MATSDDDLPPVDDVNNTSEESGKETGLFRELKRRKVFRAAGAYLVVAWLFLQVAAILLPTFAVPAWGMRVVVALLASGFPLVILIAWVYEWSPEGMRRTAASGDEDDASAMPGISRRRNWAAFCLGAAVPSVVFTVFLLMVLLLSPQRLGKGESDGIGIAILPFENLSTNEENAYFTVGMYEDLLTQLSRLSELAVASKASIRYHDENPEDLSALADKLNVRYIVEGSVQRAGEEVRVSVQLVDALEKRNVWAANFDRKLENIFSLQSEISREIAGHVRARISPEEAATLDTVPTDVVAAYDAYLKAREEITGFWVGFDVLAESQKQLEFATMADPEFVEAWAMLANVHSRRYMQLFNLDQTQSGVAEAAEAAKRALAKAIALDSDNLATLRAVGFNAFLVENDFLLGSRSLDKALQLVPNDTETLGILAFSYRRLGQIDKAIEILKDIYQTAPNEAFVFGNLTANLHDTAKYDQLIPLYERALEQSPERKHYFLEKKYYEFLVSGSLASFRDYENALRETLITEGCDPASWRRGRMTIAMLNGEFDVYAKDWKVKWEDHHRGHGDWVCPLQVNEEANHAALLLLQGKESEANDIINRSFINIDLPSNPLAQCTFDTEMIRPKLYHMQNDLVKAREDLDYAIRKNSNKPNNLIKYIEKAVLLEAADMIAPNLAYTLFSDIQKDTIRMATLETVCANPWSYPHLMEDSEFQDKVIADGRFVEFLQHFGFLKSDNI